jgi:hypothetical protein
VTSTGSIKTTLDTYSHVMPTIHADAVRRLDLMLGEVDPAGEADGVKQSAE